MDLSKENGLTQANLNFQLTPLGDVSAADIAAGLSDLDIARWLSRAPYPYSLADAQAYQAVCGEAVRAIVVGGQFAGIIGVKPDLGYWLVRRFWGQGLATAASQRLLGAHFFASDMLIISGHFAGNGPSARVLARLGFRYTHEELVTPLSTGVETVLERMALDCTGWWAAQGLPIVTKRLKLRPLRLSDAAALARIGGDARVAPMLATVKSPWPAAAVRLGSPNRNGQGGWGTGWRYACQMAG
jgi:RimJ/RimL family protein N-acetyltransferase